MQITTDPAATCGALGMIAFVLLLAAQAEAEERKRYKRERKNRPYDWRTDLPRKDRIKRGY